MRTLLNDFVVMMRGFVVFSQQVWMIAADFEIDFHH